MDVSLLLALLSGVAIAAACGLRAFLPLFVLGLGARVGWIELHPSASWLANDHALWALGTATLIEVLGDKIPVVDHALDALGTLLRPLAAWFGAYAVLQAWPTPWAQIAALALGGVALAVHGVKAKLRIGSSALTLGHGNPLLSLAEDGVALGTMVLAFVAPVVTVIVLAILARLAWRARPRAPRTP